MFKWLHSRLYVSFHNFWWDLIRSLLGRYHETVRFTAAKAELFYGFGSAGLAIGLLGLELSVDCYLGRYYERGPTTIPSYLVTDIGKDAFGADMMNAFEARYGQWPDEQEED